METTARLYNCARCHDQVIICSYCDRGNIYCDKRCALAARKASLNAAGKRYQDSFRGRVKHAERQHRYRAQRKKVTQQGSPEPPISDPLPPRPQRPESAAVGDNGGIHCRRCKRACSPFLRQGFLRRASSSLAFAGYGIHRPPPIQAQSP